MSEEKSHATTRKFSYDSKELSSRVKILAVVAITVVLALSLIVFFVLQANYEQQIRDTIFEQYKDRQVAYAKSIANNIRLDLNSLMTSLKAISLSKPVQDGQTSGGKANAFLKQAYDDAASSAKIDSISILDENGIVLSNYNVVNLKLVGYNYSVVLNNLGYKDNLPNPTYSNAYTSPVDGKLRIALLYPIYSQDTGQYVGAVFLSMDVRSFLLKYGNLDDVNQQYLVVLDKNATVLATPVKASIGQNFFAAGPQQGAANISNEHYKIVMSGQEDTALFSYRNLGTRLNTGEPIILNGKQQYSLFVVTPTDAIYAQINSVIASQRTGFYILQGAIASAIGIALYFLIRWSGTLERAVRDRTKELTKSNELLQHANEQLKVHDKLQQEFINVAAHELRTPIQPILGLTGMLQTELDGKSRIEVSREDIEILARNAMRLERLSSDLLTVARLEGRGGEMELHLESFDIQDKLRNVVGDIKKNLPSDHTVEIVYDSPSIIVQADKSKIFEVLSNLIRNAIKFTKAGKIVISASKSDGDGNEVIIRVTDTGAGIDADIMPRLFTKFVSKSGSGTGTGLGLYIARKIVEAHGGKIWAENNKDGKGATFSFSIPLRVTSANLLSGAVQEK